MPTEAAAVADWVVDLVLVSVRQVAEIVGYLAEDLVVQDWMVDAGSAVQRSSFVVVEARWPVVVAAAAVGRGYRLAVVEWAVVVVVVDHPVVVDPVAAAAAVVGLTGRNSMDWMAVVHRCMRPKAIKVYTHTCTFCTCITSLSSHIIAYILLYSHLYAILTTANCDSRTICPDLRQ